MGVSHPCGGRRMKDAPAGVSGCRVAPPTGGGGGQGRPTGGRCTGLCAERALLSDALGFSQLNSCKKFPALQVLSRSWG